MAAIYRKEMHQYFRSVIGYVFLAIFVLVNAFIFLMRNLLTFSGDITNYFKSVVILMMFLIPMLTMRSFAEERRQRTDVLLYTSPVSRTDIVLGKFFAAETVFLLGLAFTLVFPVVLAAGGSFQGWVTLGNYLGIVLLMSVFIAAGLFVSALTESQIVAAIITYVLIFALWYSYGLAASMHSQTAIRIFNYFSLMNMFYEFTLGIFDPAAVLLDLCLVFIFLFLTYVVTGRRKG